ncbi:MAG: Mobile element protein [uncultured Acetobacteraceae bacterium]|uniref:Mobile element protein n=1 Tax=uncultured Acetobacteraceae bacterium TaxID=169975 RepID=A0A6J4HM74_9PROT|nr:MAG: Mobile element protein [uncultured Acetobacteraceae bacterium]
MEDVLGVYKRPRDPKRPVVGLDEKPVQLVADVREPLPATPGVVRRQDHEYKRNGTANVFCASEPLGNWRRLAVTDRRTRVDWAHFVRDLVDAPRYRDAEVIVLVQDQLNTHTPASLYEAFAPAEAKRVADRLEIHYTPKHGSWLNVAEVELSVLGKRLKERLGDRAALAGACAAFERERNRAGKGVDWQFTTEDARVKLKRLYPAIEVS